MADITKFRIDFVCPSADRAADMAEIAARSAARPAEDAAGVLRTTVVQFPRTGIAAAAAAATVTTAPPDASTKVAQEPEETKKAPAAPALKMDKWRPCNWVRTVYETTHHDAFVDMVTSPLPEDLVPPIGCFEKGYVPAEPLDRAAKVLGSICGTPGDRERLRLAIRFYVHYLCILTDMRMHNDLRYGLFPRSRTEQEQRVTILVIRMLFSETFVQCHDHPPSLGAWLPGRWTLAMLRGMVEAFEECSLETFASLLRFAALQTEDAPGFKYAVRDLLVERWIGGKDERTAFIPFRALSDDQIIADIASEVYDIPPRENRDFRMLSTLFDIPEDKDAPVSSTLKVLRDRIQSQLAWAQRHYHSVLLAGIDETRAKADLGSGLPKWRQIENLEAIHYKLRIDALDGSLSERRYPLFTDSDKCS